MSRDPIIATVMGIIPFVNLYLIYKWWEELKSATKADYNPIVQLILCMIPLVNLYFMWKLFTGVEEAAKAKGMEGYPLGGTVLYVVSLLLVIPFLFMFYKTQEMLNAVEA